MEAKCQGNTVPYCHHQVKLTSIWPKTLNRLESVVEKDYSQYPPTPPTVPTAALFYFEATPTSLTHTLHTLFPSFCLKRSYQHQTPNPKPFRIIQAACFSHSHQIHQFVHPTPIHHLWHLRRLLPLASAILVVHIMWWRWPFSSSTVVKPWHVENRERVCVSSGNE